MDFSAALEPLGTPWEATFAYAAMTVETLRSPFCFLYTAMMSGYRAVAR
jgi:hypothetical protein